MIKGGIMKLLTTDELLQIEGGVSLSGSLINAVGSIIKIVLEVGRSIGSGLRRLYDDSMCTL